MDKFIDVNCEGFDEFEVFDLEDLLNIVDNLEELFHISRDSIAKYVSLDLDEFEEMIGNPVKHSDKLDAMFRLVNFFNAVSKASV